MVVPPQQGILSGEPKGNTGIAGDGLSPIRLHRSWDLSVTTVTHVLLGAKSDKTQLSPRPSRGLCRSNHTSCRERTTIVLKTAAVTAINATNPTSTGEKRESAGELFHQAHTRSKGTKSALTTDRSTEIAAVLRSKGITTASFTSFHRSDMHLVIL